ncbi:MAG: outer membrane beta-barrel protein [Hydrotalea flava]|uniref:outer membrane beta-barrel protein n=1 Tax=Hydrotalea TaxID=1004300 RepID=UPI0009458DC2|nr:MULTISPECIES: outer membrane beta-barrel protein [Hydrotalea]NIM34972.1 outer membrane beta-barrel protein [Hydrotalea flava]NIM37798.1 outer membrane beta-barrel protein [Hydrotalea flava]NIN02967.1 outer membrane beta-barrel protein [Hydrotalea flava]NIN14652.1 outer membrane beta-barrel protein [Hydrotalea flava]NIO93724.1 outer membrane beta-barrel protein [Hydrotalea flava]
MKYLLHKNCRIIFAFSLLSLYYKGISQFSTGLSAAYSNNHLNTNISNRSYTQNKNGNSWGISFPLNYKCSNKINFQTEIDFLNKDYSFIRTGNYAGIYTRYNNIYLQWPFIFQYKIFQKSKWQIFADVGLYASYWAFGKIKGVLPNVFNSYDSINTLGQITHYLTYTGYSQNYQFNQEKDNRFEFGASAGLSSSYQFNQKYSLVINAIYYQSLTSQQKKYSINQTMQYNQTIFISIGCMFHLHV